MTLPVVFEKRVKILLIANDQESRTILRRELQSAHFDVIVAENEKEVSCLAAAIQPDLILLDVKGPWLENFVMFERLEMDPCTRSIPIIPLAPRENVDNVVAGLGLNTVDFVVKPYSFEELQTRIRKAMMLRNEIYQRKKQWVIELLYELRGPITVVAALSKLLCEKVAHLEPSVQTAYLKEIFEHADHLGNMLKGFEERIMENGSEQTVASEVAVRLRSEK